MKQLKVAVVGSTGFIGNSLVNNLLYKNHSVIGINRNEGSEFYLDLSKSDNFNYEIFDSCDFLIFSAAISSPDICDKLYDESYKINVTGTKHVITEALDRRCKVIFLSSDAVFGNDHGFARNESHATNPNSAYGSMKKEIEDYFYKNNLFKTIRLSYVVSNEDKFTQYLIKCLEEDCVAEIYHPFYRNCVTLNEVHLAIDWLINTWDLFDSGILNLCGPELISRVRIVDEINRIGGLSIKYKVMYPDKQFFQNRPEISEMVSLYMHRIIEDYQIPFSARLEKQFGCKLSSLKYGGKK